MSRSGSLVLRTAAWCTGILLVGAALLTAVVVGGGALVGPAEARAGKELAGPAAAAQEFARRAAVDPAGALAECTPARPTDVDALAGTLPEGAVPGRDAYALADGALLFVAVPVGGEGLAEGAGDRAVWVYGRQGHAAVTDDARALSPRLPGPQHYGLDPAAPPAERAATCVEATRRAAASGGPAVPAGR